MRRVRVPWIEPLELWDAVIEGRTLFDWQRDPGRLPAVLGALVARLNRDEYPALTSVYMLGGGALAATFSDGLPGAGLPVTVAGDPLFAAVRAGAALADDALVVDVGQCAVKASWRGALLRRPRDRARLPIASTLSLEGCAVLRANFVGFVAGAMRDALAGGAPGSVVLALSCALDGDGVASGCSYPYVAPDAALARDILVGAGLDVLPALVLNDAELAAHAAALDERTTRNGDTLVLTMGFGVGAAVLRCDR